MNTFREVKKIITEMVNDSIKVSYGDIPDYNFMVEVPKEATFGDFSTNAAMLGAKVLRKNPHEIAQNIVNNFKEHIWIESVCVMGAFINFKMSKFFYSDVVKAVLSEKENFGRSDYGKCKKIIVEFVSANPTGPMHIGNARGGATGDCLASVLNFAGYKATREFYVNDSGNQMEKFGMSLSLRYLQLYNNEIEMPEDSYHGEDIIEHAKNFAKIHGDKYVSLPSDELKNVLIEYALPLNIANLKTDLASYRIIYDNWAYESEFHKNGAVSKVIEIMKEKGYTYEKDGAIWFAATEFGCDKDFVLVRANGFPTYIVPDIAYHYDKLVTRGYDKAINVLGADHHGYVSRLKACLKAIDIDPDRLDIVLIQMVNLVRDGEVVKASKRSGKAITLVTLLEEIPTDAARFFFNLREPNSHFDFDLDLSVSKNNQNPVYYVQYAHARICSILSALDDENIDINRDFEPLLSLPNEVALVKKLSIFAEEIVRSAEDYDVSRMTKYAIDLATAFHSFYNECRVRCDDENLMYARIGLIQAVKITLENVLNILDVSAPDKM